MPQVKYRYEVPLFSHSTHRHAMYVYPFPPKRTFLFTHHTVCRFLSWNKRL